MANFMKSGEFARVCRTTKETLRHYETLGLVRPAYKAANGYNMYSAAQAFDFVLVRALHSSGVPLKSIAPLLDKPDTALLAATLAEREESLGTQIAELKRKQSVLQETLRKLKRLEFWEHMDAAEPKWTIEEFPKERFIETLVVFEEEETDILDALSEHLSYCDSHQYGIEMQWTYRIESADLKGQCVPAKLYVASRIDRPVKSEHFHTKAQGAYFCSPFFIPAIESSNDKDESANPLLNAVKSFMKLASNHGCMNTNDVYISELGIGSNFNALGVHIEFSMR